MGGFETRGSAWIEGNCLSHVDLDRRTMPDGVHRWRTYFSLQSTQSQKYLICWWEIGNPLSSPCMRSPDDVSSSIIQSDPPGWSNRAQQQSGFAQRMLSSLSLLVGVDHSSVRQFSTRVFAHFLIRT